jgi:cysteine desulfurase/selenocysteine lyase
MRERLADLPGVQVHDLGRERCGLVTFTVDGHSPDKIREQLAARRISVSVSRARSTRLDMARRHLAAVVRASVHYYNSEDEIDRLIEAVARLIGQGRHAEP